MPRLLIEKLPRIDPRQVAVRQIDDHLPAIDARELAPQALRQRFLNPPIWSPEFSAEKRFSDRALAPAAVLIAVVMHPEPTVLLTQRTEHLSSHSGQIAFPGGKVDATDVDAGAAALRETFEEVGLHSDFIEVLGQMPMYLTGSAFMVTPIVALVKPGFVVYPSAEEVADVFEVPLQFLMNPANHRHHQVHWQGVDREWLSMPYQDKQVERFIWGATAGMLRNFYRFLAA
jgi:8-oxo-dGTP pyrophosphatase MutT (NUDIX family)